MSRTPEVRFSRPCRASAETVYDVLADPGTHLQWGGDEQRWFVTYTLRQESITSPILRMRLPLVRTMCWKIGIPVLGQRGFRTLLRFAEHRVEAPAPVR